MNLPSLFISHGSPMLALEAGATGAAWRQMAARWPKPRAVLVASAHWLTRRPGISQAARPATLHDYGGFDPTLQRVQYPAPGAPVLAAQIAQRLAAAGLPVDLHPDRGLDHGAWVPLRHLYPEADIPTLQLSIQPQAGPDHHLRLGEALAGLGEEGVLLIGSGSLTHNLAELDWGSAPDAVIHAYVADFTEWMALQLTQGDRATLLDYRRQAPGAQQAHPSDEHLLPLFVALGAGGPQAQAERLHHGYTEGGLAMDVYAFG